eukprot:508945-Pyramimonas_sp.AAC.1
MLERYWNSRFWREAGRGWNWPTYERTERTLEQSSMAETEAAAPCRESSRERATYFPKGLAQEV